MHVTTVLHTDGPAARSCDLDLDHMVAYLPLDQGGRPDGLENLACLCPRYGVLPAP